MFHRFNRRALDTLRTARNVAKNNSTVASRHILVALSLDPEIQKGMEALGMSSEALRNESARYDDQLPTQIKSYTSNAKKVLERAANSTDSEITIYHLISALAGSGNEELSCAEKVAATVFFKTDTFTEIKNSVMRNGISWKQSVTETVLAKLDGLGAEKYLSPFTNTWV